MRAAQGIEAEPDLPAREMFLLCSRGRVNLWSMPLDDRHIVHNGRGATFNPRVRFESTDLDPFDDGWDSLAQARADDPPPRTRGHAR